MVKHFLIEYEDLALIRQLFFFLFLKNMNNIKDLFKNVNIGGVVLLEKNKIIPKIINRISNIQSNY